MNTSTLPDTLADQTAAAAPPPDARPDKTSAAASLIEFPRPGRSKPPQWRKELSERVREIQQRRALEAARDADEDAPTPYAAAGADGAGADAAAVTTEAVAPQLGLVPTPEPAEVNPIVAKALERIERARRQAPPHAPSHAQHARAAAAHAPAVARQTEDARPPAPAAQSAAPSHATDATADATAAPSQSEAAFTETAEPTAEPARATTLVVVPPPPAPDNEADAAIREALSRPRPRRHIPEVADDALLLRREAEVVPTPLVHEEERPYGERAPLVRRVVAGLADLVVVAFASSPFAAIIELTSGRWHDPRVAACLAGIVLTIMFLYATVSVAFSGRTWGMALLSLRAVDARSGLIPTAGQCARRALFHMLSLAALGLGLLPALFDRDGRAAHDRLSRTVVVVE